MEGFVLLLSVAAACFMVISIIWIEIERHRSRDVMAHAYYRLTIAEKRLQALLDRATSPKPDGGEGAQEHPSSETPTLPQGEQQHRWGGCD